MSRITRNTKRMFEVRDRTFESGGVITCVQGTDADHEQLWVNGIKLNAKQCQKLIAWLRDAHRVISGFRGM